MSTTLITSPASVELLPQDSVVFSYDATPILKAGETVNTLTTSYVEASGDAIALPDAPIPTVSGGFQRLRGSSIEPGSTNWLTWTVLTSTGDTMSQVTEVTGGYP